MITTDKTWVVDIEYFFTDDNYLYLVMEFHAGGNLMSLQTKKDIFSEEEARFYIAEILLALESVHKMNYIHRDLQPENILICSDGHIKLIDFGYFKYKKKIKYKN